MIMTSSADTWNRTENRGDILWRPETVAEGTPDWRGLGEEVPSLFLRIWTGPMLPEHCPYQI